MAITAAAVVVGVRFCNLRSRFKGSSWDTQSHTFWKQARLPLLVCFSFHSCFFCPFVAFFFCSLFVSFCFFSHSGFEKFRGTPAGEKAAQYYNESAFLFALQTIPTVLHNTPLHFADIVRAHFSMRKDAILNRCHSYLRAHTSEATTGNSNNDNNISSSKGNGNTANNNNNAGSESGDVLIIPNPSVGFLSELAAFVPKLEQALAGLGSSPHQQTNNSTQ